MERELAARDEGKPVVGADGEQLGVVSAVEDDSARTSTPTQDWATTSKHNSDGEAPMRKPIRFHRDE